MKKRHIQFVKFANGCNIPLTHKLNKDGYYRRIWSYSQCDSGEVEREMFHRFIWRMHNGEIPEGHEVNHKCRNRACCNPDHLEVLSRKEHLVMTNRTRYRGRINKGKQMLLEGLTRKEIATKLKVNWTTVNNWANQLGWESL